MWVLELLRILSTAPRLVFLLHAIGRFNRHNIARRIVLCKRSNTPNQFIFAISLSVIVAMRSFFVSPLFGAGCKQSMTRAAFALDPTHTILLETRGEFLVNGIYNLLQASYLI